MDLHSLRHSPALSTVEGFGTLLAHSGVAPRTAQELMRHCDSRLATNIHKRLALADTAPALNRLLAVPFETAPAMAIST